MKLSSLSMSALVAVGLLTVGCGGVVDVAGAPTPAFGGPVPEVPALEAEAGVVVASVPDPTHADLRQEAAAMEIAARTDPFALHATERAFEALQSSERLFSELGTFAVYYEEPPRAPVEEQLDEQQPLRRLSGIIQADGVIALIEMEDGRTHEIRPGSQIEDSEWTVVSIDNEGAVLRREGNRRPREIYVRLQGRFTDAPAPGGGDGFGPAGPGAPGGADAGREGMGAEGGGPFGPGGRGGPRGRGGDESDRI